MKNNIIWFLKIAFCLFLLLFISLVIGCPRLGEMGVPVIDFVLYPLKGCWTGAELRDLKLLPTLRTMLSVIWYLLIIGIFLVIPFHHKKYFEQAEFYVGYKIFWFVGSLVFALLWLTLMDLDVTWVLLIIPQNNEYSTSETLIDYAIHILIIAFVVWRLAVIPATKQYKNRGN
jgi:hypothetical protein